MTPDIPEIPSIPSSKWQREICAILVLDEESQERVNHLRREMVAHGLPPGSVHGHVTLAHFHKMDPDTLITWTRNFLQDRTPFDLIFNKVDHLGPCLVFYAEDSEILNSWYEEYNQHFDYFSDPFTSLREGQWTPHATLFCDEKMDKAEQLIEVKRIFKPFRARVVRLELSEILDEGYRILAAFDFT